MKMKKQLDIKKLLLLNMPYILMGLFATNFGEGWRMAVGADASAKMLSFFSTLPVALASWWPSLHPLDLLVGLCCGAGLRLAVYLKSKNAKKYRHGMEYGSARWGTHEDIAPYIDPVFQNNVILTKTESLTMNSRPKDPKTARNKNVLVIGGSGSGKTRFWLKPNLMQMHSSYVVTDPKGTILVECGKMLQRGTPKLGKDGKPMKDKHGKDIYEPYRIKVLNTINFKKSMHYNPFAYIHSEKDILKLVTTLIANTKGEGKAGDDFWVKAETLLYCALIGYIHYEAPVEEQNFSTLIEFINAMEVREDDEEFKNPVDLMFDALEAEKPNHFAVRQYKKYKLAAGKTAKSILISCGARLAVFDIAGLREVTAYDELELDTLGDRKTALFLIMSDTDDSFNFLISMCYTQLFNLLCEKADDVYGGRLPVHVRCLIDEAANIGQIPRLEKLVATIRSREISACLVLQAQSQLKAIYKDNADTIIGNMDTSIFLGGKEPTTLKELAAVLGKETIDTYNTGESRGRETSHSLNYQKLGKDYTLYDVATMKQMDGGQLDGPDMGRSTAVSHICEDLGMGGKSIKYAPLSMIETLQEAAYHQMQEQVSQQTTEAAATQLPDAQEQALDEYPMPDPALTQDDLEKCGYLDGDLLPLSKERAYELMERDLTVYIVQEGENPEMAFDTADLDAHDGIFAVSREEWEQSPDFHEKVLERQDRQLEREQAFLSHEGNCFAIYQVSKDDPQNVRFMNLDWLQSHNLSVERSNYDLIYTAPLDGSGSTMEQLERLYEQFNLQKPVDFHSPSMSVSDIVAIKQNGQVSCHYCDSVGFTQVQGFLPENSLRNAEMTVEDDYGMIDGIINNGPKEPTVAQLEQQARSGQPISLMDLAAAVHREEREKKKSVMEQLKSQPKTEHKKTAQKKSAEREL